MTAKTMRRVGWVGRFYLLAATLLVPWVAYLVVVLPTHQLTVHYDLAWVGFDGALAVLLLVTGILVVRRKAAVVLPAAATAAMLLSDAWFDTVTSAQGGPRVMALVLAVAVEVPLAVLSLTVAVRVLRRLARTATG